MKFGDPFPHDMTAGTFVDTLDKMVPRPHVTSNMLADEKGRMDIALDEGKRELVDRLIAWMNRKEGDRG